MTKTERLINRINDVPNFENVAYVCEALKHSWKKLQSGESITSQELILTIQT